MRAIGKRLSCGKSTVQDILVKKQETDTTDNKERSGRPRATTESQEKFIRVATLMDRFRPSHDIARNILNTKSQEPISSKTVRRRQVEATVKFGGGHINVWAVFPVRVLGHFIKFME